MKNAIVFALVLACILFFYILEGLYHVDKEGFMPPLEQEIRIRYDGYGSGNFGARRHGSTHKGVDILAAQGTPIMAAKSGWAFKGKDEDGYGNYVRIYHAGDLMTLYAHMEKVNFRWVKRVRQGDVIGYVGTSGNARYEGMRPHVHMEVRLKGEAIDPMRGYLTR